MMDKGDGLAKRSPVTNHHDTHRRKSGVNRTSSPGGRLERLADRTPPVSNGNLWDGRNEGVSALNDDALSSDHERVRVTIRVRPPTETEAESQGAAVLEIDPSKGIVVVHRDESTEFQFDAVLPPSASQGDVYGVAARPVVADVLNGYNGTVMAYGQTGAGKTYTLSSTQEGQLGIIPRAAAEVFTMANADDAHEYRVSMSYIQIYMEMIQDLLRPSTSNMQIRESDQGGVYISGVEEVEVGNIEDCLKYLALGERNRAFAFTKLNAHSSRSHAIAVITVEKKRKKGHQSPEEREAAPSRIRMPSQAQDHQDARPQYYNNNSHHVPHYQLPLQQAAQQQHQHQHSHQHQHAHQHQHQHHNQQQQSQSPADQLHEEPANGAPRERILIGKLFLVDLAGSERLKKSGSEGVRASEAKSVNLSLTSLGKCINARADPLTTHVPFRDSKLTRLLQESLGGNAKTSLVINVAPTVHHVSESMSSLLFGSRAMKVRTRPQVNEEDEYRQLSRSLQETIDLHDDRVHSLEVVVYSQEEQLAQAKARLDLLDAQLAELQAENAELAAANRKNMIAQEAMWEKRVEEVQAAHQRLLEDTREVYRDNLSQTEEANDAQREGLAQTLRATLAQVSRLEEEVSRVEEEKRGQVALLEAREAAALKLLSEAAARRDKEEAAALAIQRAFRVRQHERIKSQLANAQQRVESRDRLLSRVEEENVRLKEMAAAAGRRLVGQSLANMTAAVTALNRRFLTPRNQL
eukprot:TRINITY_DN1725_c0_g1_i1.p1 TRINITY_DN1725_c0_g1~~TRINITY_DN1725_c0_g1_i1.p1  ORF type:complete len:749 (-),score=129.47 TRINITY_DN1725_c0_g1_i1:469-2715(-)